MDSCLAPILAHSPLLGHLYFLNLCAFNHPHPSNMGVGREVMAVKGTVNSTDLTRKKGHYVLTQLLLELLCYPRHQLYQGLLLFSESIW